MPAPSTTPVAFPRDLTPYEERLHDVYGYTEFRRGQADVLLALATRDVLGVMPTGGGKSLCYVLPALEVGRTVVVSPLIALMQDQVEALQALGLPAAFVNSTLAPVEQQRRLAAFARGELALLFVAPERFARPDFVAALQRSGVALFVIDEAHCISEWGHDFRPEYLELGVARQRLGAPRTLALTATADPQVRRDIMRRLGIEQGAEVVTTFDRPNLRFAAQRVSGEQQRTDALLRVLRAHPGKAGIVYARTRRSVEETAALLVSAGFNAAGYHAGMPSEERAAIQRRFLTGRVPIMVATTAFGMGIDKPDVRFVVHLQLPGRIEAYYQEAGRAGRDGEPAECTLLFAAADQQLQRRFIMQAHPPDSEQRRYAESRLAQLAEYAETTGCRRAVILRYFGEAAQDRCDHCDNCSDGPQDGGGAYPQEVADALLQLRAELADEAGRPPYMVFEERTAREAATYRPRLDEELLAIWGMGEARIRWFGARMLAVIARWEAEHPDAPPRLVPSPQERQAQLGRAERAPIASADAPLAQALREWRAARARSAGTPAFIIFNDRTLADLVARRPRSRRELLAVSGIGPARVEQFGDELLTLVREHSSPA